MDSFSSRVGGNATSCLLATAGVLKTLCAAPLCWQACTTQIRNRRQFNLAIAAFKDLTRAKKQPDRTRDRFRTSSKLGNVMIALTVYMRYSCSIDDRYVVEEDKVRYVHSCWHDHLTSWLRPRYGRCLREMISRISCQNKFSNHEAAFVTCDPASWEIDVMIVAFCKHCVENLR